MLYITWDIHGIHEVSRLSPLGLRKSGVRPLPGPGDHVVIAGDFGLV